MISKEKIIEEIKRTAKENSEKPLGTQRFEQETGIKPYDWQKYWARFGDAQREAGFSPNTLNSALDLDFMMDKIISLTRKLNKIPTSTEFRVEKNNDPDFPSKNTLQKLGSKEKLAQKLIDYCKDKEAYIDIISLCSNVLNSQRETIEQNNYVGEVINNGEVYLFKSGKYYKIGKTNDTVRRGTELKIQLPENLDLIHSIKTDDPSGVEGYWHKRFEAKRLNGEWFNLNPSDIKAFKRWRKIY